MFTIHPWLRSHMLELFYARRAGVSVSGSLLYAGDALHMTYAMRDGRVSNMLAYGPHASRYRIQVAPCVRHPGTWSGGVMEMTEVIGADVLVMRLGLDPTGLWLHALTRRRDARDGIDERYLISPRPGVPGRLDVHSWVYCGLSPDPLEAL